MDEPINLEGLSERQRRLLELMLKRQAAASAEDGARQRRPAITRRSGTGPAALSYAQQRLWFIEQLQPGTAAYNIPAGVRLRGPFHAGLFRAALARTAARHETMRTTFVLEGGRPVQRVAPQVEAQLPLIDLRRLDAEKREQVGQRLVDTLARRPFSLAVRPAWRALLVRLAEAEHIFLVVMHHIIADTWTTGVFFREVTGHYKNLMEGGPLLVPELTVQYGDYSTWQRQAADGGELQSQVDYWVQQLAEAPPLLDLPTDRPRPPVQTFRGGRVTLVLPSALTDRLKEVSAQRDATFFMTLMASYQLLLYRYTNEPDVLVGTPMANRDRVELENLIGLFVNTLVLRTRFEDAESFCDLLSRVRETTLAGLSNHDVPFERVVEELALERDTSRNPLFQVLFAFQNVPIPKLVAEGLTLERFEFRESTARLELELDLQEMPYGFVGWLGYNADLFDAATAERMAANYRVLLEGIAEDPTRSVRALPLLCDAERNQVVAEWNDTVEPFDREATLHGLFERRAQLQPGAVAVLAGDESLTYAELEARANQLAHLLVARGVAPGAPVGVCLRRGLDSVVSLLGILKAGASYVPLDLAFPVGRMRTILATAGATCLLTQRGLLDQLGELLPSLGTVVGLDDPAELAGLPTSRVDRVVSAIDWAYTIFTSGSTGTPKGVMVQHRPVSNLIEWATGTFGFGPTDRVLFVTALSFDLSVFDVFGVLASGGSIRVASDEEAKDPEALLRILASEPITFWDSAPAALQQLAAFFPQQPIAGSRLRLAFLSGDWIPVVLPDQVRATFPGCKVISLGGATEATVWSNVFPIAEVPSWWRSIPYGRPIQNARYLVLDGALAPQPVNAAGDLFIAGECLSFGYLGSPALTAWKYVPDPHGTTPGGRLYRTGDRARFWKDGNLEFLGRLDHQVKIRGYRIELGEIAAALTDHEAVRDAVVLVREDTTGDRRLVAYVVAAGGEMPPVPELRAHLQSRLPDYMVPAVYLAIDEVPVTANGKLDRDALPTPNLDRPELKQAFVDPENEVEETVAELWKRVLQVDRIGRHDNFFELGGHSLLLTQIHGELQERLSASLTLVDLFTYPTLASLSEHLSRSRDSKAEVAGSLDRAAARREAGLGAGQEAIAIIGMALRFPKAKDVGQFWQNIREGVDCIDFFSEDEILAAGVDPELARHPDYVRAEGTVSDVDGFDWRFFGYGTPEEVELLDPQQRIFMEIAWECFERAGYDPFEATESIGVFGGVNISSYLFNSLYDYDPYNVMSSFLTRIGLLVGNQNDYLCTRLAYHFNLKGPAVTVQTACSTATVATHLACQSLLRNECDLCLAGGVQIRVPQNMGYLYQEGGFPSPDGHCRSFDAKAKGNVHGNGAGILLLKRLSEAVRDGDHIHAVIRGSAIANDGSVKVGFTAPGVSGQARVAAEAMAVAGVHPEEIGYLEATGTGTELGDPIEIDALTKAHRLRTEARGYCPIGSVKANIGHTDAASGAAALIKTALALEHEEIPPSIHFETPNPRIAFDESPFFVNTTWRPWPRTTAPRRAAVHTYAVGGTNTHVILEEPPLVPASGPSRSWQLLPLSARTSTALQRATEALASHLANGPGQDQDLADVAATLQRGRRHFAMRRLVLCRDKEEAIELLRDPEASRVATGLEAQDPPSLLFLLPEPESLEIELLREFHRDEPAFRAAWDEAIACLDPELRGVVAHLVNPAQSAAESGSRLVRETYRQPALFAATYALAKVWLGWGVRPRRLVGTGLGELVAACVGGSLELADAVALSVARGRALEASPVGVRLEVRASRAEIEPRLEEGLRLSAELGERLAIVSGPAELIERCQARLEEDGLDVFLLGECKLPPAVGDAGLAELRALLTRVLVAVPELDWWSTAAGAEGSFAAEPGHWEHQLSAPVELRATLAGFLAEPRWLLLEISFNPQLAAEIERTEGRQARVLGACADETLPELGGHLRTLGELWAQGAPIDWRAFSSHERRHRVPLPTYGFERQRIWAEPKIDRKTAYGRLAGREGRLPLADWLSTTSWSRLEGTSESRGLLEPGLRLVFAEPGSAAETIAKLLQQRGQEVLLVQRGQRWAAPRDGVCVVRPGVLEDYQHLVDAVGLESLSGVVFGWSLQASLVDDPVEAASRDGFWQLVALTRALGRRQQPLQLDVLTCGGQDVTGEEELVPGRALLIGLAKVIPQEYPNLRCRTLDLGVEVVETARPGAFAAVAEELCLQPVAPVVAVRGSRLWVQSHVRVDVPAAGLELRSGGVILLTGGAHAMNLAMAETLATKAALRFAFVGDSGLPPRLEWDRWIAEWGNEDATSRRLLRLAALENQGSEVLLVEGDLAQVRTIEAALSRVETLWGEVTGVVFSAGELVPEFARGLAQLDEEFVTYRLQQRLRALTLLDQALAGRNLDFFLLSSTVASAVGGLAIAVEAAADAFLDTFARDRRRSGAPWLSISWDALRLGHEDRETAIRLPAEAIKLDELRELLGRIAGHAFDGHVVVSTTNLSQRVERALMGGDRGGEVEALRQRPADLPQTYVAPRSELETEVAAIWEEVLGLAPVGVEDNYFDLGGNSLLATQLVSRLRGKFQVELALQGFFEGATVAHVARNLEAARWAGEMQEIATVVGAEGELESGEI